MTLGTDDTASSWVDPDDAPEWTDEQFARAEFRIGERVIRPRAAAVARDGDAEPPPAVVAAFRVRGPDWQARMADVIERAAGL